MTQFDVAYVRSQFPALKRTIDGRPAAYLDGPGGTQTPRPCAAGWNVSALWASTSPS